MKTIIGILIGLLGFLIFGVFLVYGAFLIHPALGGIVFGIELACIGRSIID